MNLNLFNNLLNTAKKNNIIQSFIKELDESLENNKINQVPLLQKVLDGRTLTTTYRDKINIKRHEIITNYSIKNAKQGKFYYVYSKGDDNTYGIVEHKNGKSSTDIWVEESQLPKGAGVDSVLTEQNGKFILNKNATEKIQKELTEMINKLLEEQANKLKSQRIEGHIYEFVEKSLNTVELMDVTNNTGECFEEIDFPSELADKATQGTMFQYVNGEYQSVNK